MDHWPASTGHCNGSQFNQVSLVQQFYSIFITVFKDFFRSLSVLILMLIFPIVSLFTVCAPITLPISGDRTTITPIYSQIGTMGSLQFHNNNNKSCKPWSTKSLPNPKSQVQHRVPC